MFNLSVNSFGYVPSKDMGHAIPCSVKQIREGFCDPEVLGACQTIAPAATRARRGEMTPEGFEKLKSAMKKRLPGWTPMATFRGERRVASEAILNGLVMADLDHLEDPVGVYERSIRPLAEEGIVRLCHLTPSTASDRSIGGLRIIFPCPEGMDIAQAQAWLYNRLTDVPEDRKDTCVKDPSRISFFVPKDYILYPADGVDGLERVFTDITPPVVEPAAPVAEQPAAPVQPEPLAATPKAQAADDLPKEFMGTPYIDIVQALLQELGGTPPVGQRNNRVHRLAVHLRGITDNNEALLRSIIPTFGLPEAEWRNAIHSACQSEGAPWVTHLMQKVLSQLDPEVEQPAPPMPAKLPRLVNHLLVNIPEQYRPNAAQAIFPALASYLYRVSFDYIDGREMEPALMHLTIAPSSTGKSCVKDLISRITARIAARSAVNRERDQQWKNQSVTRSANERGKQRPSDLVIQYVQPDMTSAALIQRLHDADGRFLFTQMDELDNLDKLKDQKTAVIKAAFDCAEWGSERVGKESVSYATQMRYNFCASTTPGGARKFFVRSLTDGTLNRMNISTIPQQEIGASMPRYGRYTEQWEAKMAKSLDNLEAVTGHVRCPQAERLAEALDRELKDIAIATDDRTFETLSFRANVIGYRKAIILWLANGCKWEKAIEDFIRWSVHYDLWCKYRFFGEAIARAEAEDNAYVGRRGPVNWLTELKQTFTLDDLMQARARLGSPTDVKHAKKQIQTWIDRHHVSRGSEAGTYVKLRQ